MCKKNLEKKVVLENCLVCDNEIDDVSSGAISQRGREGALITLPFFLYL